MRKSVIAAALALTFSASAMAGSADVEKRINELYPNTKVTSVKDSLVKGVYEVVMGRNVAYSDESGRYLIFGHLYDMKEQKDLTATVIESLNTVEVKSLNPADAIKTVKGKGERKLYVFSDPDCPYCKRLDAEVKKLDNVTIYTYIFPLEGLHPNAKSKGESIWCAKDQSKAWADFMDNGKVPESAKCDTPIARTVALAAKLGITGTPTIIFENGTMAPGALPAEEIDRRLTAAKSKSKGS